MTGISRQCGRFGKFNLVGLMGAALQLAIFEILFKYSHAPAAAAAALSVEVAVVHNFFWHERFTWSDRVPGGSCQRAARLLRFHLSNGLVPLAANIFLISCLVEQLGAPAVPSALTAIAICAPLNFWLADRWVYRDEAPLGLADRDVRGAPTGRAGPRANAILIESRLKKLQHSAQSLVYSHFFNNTSH